MSKESDFPAVAYPVAIIAMADVSYQQAHAQSLRVVAMERTETRKFGGMIFL